MLSNIFWQDAVNGIFEMAGAPFIFLSVLKLYKDKEVKGVSWAATAFFSSCGLWNLYFYPFMGAWLSFFGGLALVLVNLIWLAQIVYYLKWPGGRDEHRAVVGADT